MIDFRYCLTYMAIERTGVQARRNPNNIMMDVLGPDKFQSPTTEIKPPVPVIDPKLALLEQRRALLALRQEEMAFMRYSGVGEVLGLMAGGLATKGLTGRVVSNYAEHHLASKPKYDSPLQMYKSVAPEVPMITADQPYEMGLTIGILGEPRSGMRVSITVARDEQSGELIGLRFANKDVVEAPNVSAEAEEAFVTRFSRSMYLAIENLKSRQPKPKLNKVTTEVPSGIVAAFEEPKFVSAGEILTREAQARNFIVEVEEVLKNLRLKAMGLDPANIPSIPEIPELALRAEGEGYDSAHHMFILLTRGYDLQRLTNLAFAMRTGNFTGDGHAHNNQNPHPDNELLQILEKEAPQFVYWLRSLKPPQ